MRPDQSLVDRFAADLAVLAAPDVRLGIGVSGGPDSLALLLLAAAARPGQVEAATVDHGFRPEAKDEAAMVAGVCDRLGVPHSILTARWNEIPATAIQERARRERYRLLGFWAEERGLGALTTAHHADDQAETFVMRLIRGAGVRGLAGMRPRSIATGTEVRLIRPLLGWRREELVRICEEAGVTPAADPSNHDESFERVRVRRALAETAWLDPIAIARSAAHLAQAESALEWAARTEWDRNVRAGHDAISLEPDGLPRELLRRIVSRAVRKLATEGEAELRGTELDRLLATLSEGGASTLRGVYCRGGEEWRFTPAPARQA